MKDFLDFISRQVEKAKGPAAYLDVAEESYAGLNVEEKANARELAERDAVYLQGLANGLRQAGDDGLQKGQLLKNSASLESNVQGWSLFRSFSCEPILK